MTASHGGYGGVREGWRCVRRGRVYPLGTPRCGSCAAALARAVGELRALRTGLPPHLTTFDLEMPTDEHTSSEPPADAGTEGLAPRVEHLVRLLRAGQVLTGESVGELFECSSRTGRRLLAEAQRFLSHPTD